MTTRLFAFLSSLSLFTLMASAVPIAVLSASITPMSTLSKFFLSQSWLSVMGDTMNGLEAKVIMPILSLGRFSTNSRMTAFTASMRVMGAAALGEKSRAAIEPDTSMVRTMSMPLSSRSLYPLPSRGRASAVMSSASASSVSANLHIPGFALFFPDASFAIATHRKYYRAALARRRAQQRERRQQQKKPQEIGICEVEIHWVIWVLSF